MAHHHVATLARHSQEVCGLKWSPDGKFLASGGNDNLLLVWDASVNTISNSNTPLHTLNQHQAAVKVSRPVELLDVSDIYLVIVCMSHSLESFHVKRNTVLIITDLEVLNNFIAV